MRMQYRTITVNGLPKALLSIIFLCGFNYLNGKPHSEPYGVSTLTPVQHQAHKLLLGRWRHQEHCPFGCTKISTSKTVHILRTHLWPYKCTGCNIRLAGDDRRRLKSHVSCGPTVHDESTALAILEIFNGLGSNALKQEQLLSTIVVPPLKDVVDQWLDDQDRLDLLGSFDEFSDAAQLDDNAQSQPGQFIPPVSFQKPRDIVPSENGYVYWGSQEEPPFYRFTSPKDWNMWFYRNLVPVGSSN